MRLHEIEARLVAIAKEIETRGTELTAEQLTALEGEVTALKTERAGIVAAAEQRNGILNSIAEGRSGGNVVRSFPSPAAAPAGGEQRQEDDPYNTMEYRRAFMNYTLRGTPIPAEFRADATSKTSENGAVIPTTILDRIVEKMEAVGMILPLVTQTAYKGGVSVPTSSAKPVATWTAEGTGSDKQKKATGSITFAYHKLRCAVAVSVEMNTVALPVFETSMVNNVVEAMTRGTEESIVSGDGVGKPKGVLKETPPEGQALTSKVPCYADLVNAEAVLPLAYEGKAVWCMSKKTFMTYAGLCDEVGQPIGRTNYGIAGKPERSLMGRPVVCCDYVPSFAAGLEANKVYAFLFDFTDYILNTNYAMTIKKYEDNETDDMVTKAIMLVDGKVVDKNSLVTIAMPAA